MTSIFNVSSVPRKAVGGKISRVIGCVLILVTASACGASGKGMSTKGSGISRETVPVVKTRGLQSFIGIWYGNGRSLQIKSDANFIISVETFRPCQQYAKPCDSATSFGDVATGRLTFVSGTTAVGLVTKTSDPEFTPVGRITMTFSTFTDTITADRMLFCGNDAAAGTCGA